MLIRKAYKFRIKVTAEIESKLSIFTGHCRFVWNKFLALNFERLQNKQPIMRYREMDFWHRLWKRTEERQFLNECPAHCLQQKLMDLEKAFMDAFDKQQPNKRLPTRRKKVLHDSIRFPAPKHFVIDNRRIKLPKLGWIRFYKSCKIVGAVRNATIRRQSGHWYLSLQVEQQLNDTLPKSTTIIGIDVGITQFATCSDGQSFEPIHAFRKLEKKLANYQRRVSKKQKFSNNWQKAATKVRRIHSKIANIRRDFLHKCTTPLSNSHAMIVVEALKVSNMSRSASGDCENPGKNVRAKSSLNKSILDQGWYEFKRQLKYKLEWHGGSLLEVPPKNTSLCCSVCGHIEKANRLSQALFRCKHCSHEENADLNAAKNILAAGHAVMACGASG